MCSLERFISKSLQDKKKLLTLRKILCPMETASVRTITEIIDADTGELLHIDDYFFRQNEAYLFLLRRRLYEYAYLKIGQPKYLCAVCRQPVVLLGKKTSRGQIVYFAHYKDSDDCPIKTHSREMSEDDIRRSIYIGETEQHRKLKHLIYSALETSHINDVTFSHIKKEERIASKLDFRSWAIPDIYAECGDLKLNFEVQISTLFLSTIIERDVFYRFHGIFIIWIFTPEAVNKNTISRKDIVWTNNGNMFVYDQTAREQTEQTGELTLLCQWYELVDDNPDKVRLTNGKYVTLSDLIFDRQINTVYYVDVASDIERLHPGYRKERIEMEQMELEALDRFRVCLDEATPIREEVIEDIKANYDDYRDFSEGLAAVKKDNKWGFVNLKGKKVISTKYDDCRDFSNGFAAIEVKNKWGFIDRKGKRLVTPKYYIVKDFSEGYAHVAIWLNVILRNRKYNSYYDLLKWGVVNSLGVEVVTPQYEYIGKFQDGYAIVSTQSLWQNEKYWGIIDTNGEAIIYPRYEACHNFSEGLAAVRCNGKWGFSDTNGDEVIPPLFYQVVQDFENGYAMVRTCYEGSLFYINKQGRLVIKKSEMDILLSEIYETYRDFSEGLAAVKLNGKWGFINAEGVEVIVPQYAEVVQDFCDGLAIVKKEIWGQGIRINLQGNVVVKNNDNYIEVPSIYDEYRDFSEGLAAVKLNGKWGFINTQGMVIVSPQYDYVDNFNEEYALVCVRKLWGIINKDGTPLVPTKYAQISNIVNGAAIALDHYGAEFQVSVDTGDVVSIWDNYIKGKQKVDVCISLVKYNGYECRLLDPSDKGYNRILFLPKKLADIQYTEGDETEVYIVKNSGRSIIVSTLLCANNFTIGEVCKGIIQEITSYGIFVKILNSNVTTLAHISTFEHSIKGYNIGDVVDVEIVTQNEQMQRVGVKFV